MRVRKLFEVLKQTLIEGIIFFANGISLELFLAEQSDDEAKELIEVLHLLLVRINPVKVSNLWVKLSNKKLSNRINCMRISCFLSFITVGVD